MTEASAQHSSVDHEDRRAFACKIGSLIERCGHPRIAGQIVGWLLVSDPPEQSFSDLVETLGASKGSISTMTRRLERSGLIERLCLAGDRQTYFRIQPGAWQTMLRREMAVMDDLRAAAEDGLALMEDCPDASCERLRAMHDFHAFVAKKMPALVEEYESQQQAEAPSPS